MREELPLKHIEEPKKFDEGAESKVFEFKPEKGKNYVYKEIRNEDISLLENYPGKTLEEKAASMKTVYDVLKKHYGDRIVDTHFIVAKNEEGESCITKIQEKIKGDCISDLGKKRDPRFHELYERVLKMPGDEKKVADEIMKNKRFVEFKKQHPDFEEMYGFNVAYSLIIDLRSTCNIIVDKKGNLKIIDW